LTGHWVADGLFLLVLAGAIALLVYSFGKSLL
jgi:hypothetical protein